MRLTTLHAKLTLSHSLLLFAVLSAEQARGRPGLLLATAGLALAGVGLAFVVTRSVSRAALACSSAADRISSGDLREDLHLTRSDELGRLRRSMASMAEHLRDEISRMRHASRALAEESARSWASARDLLGGTTAQRSTSSELAARLTELSASLVTLGTIAGEAEALAAALPSLAGLTTMAGTLRRALDELWSGVLHVTRGLVALEDVAKRDAAVAGELWEHAEAAAAEARSLQDLAEAFQIDRPTPGARDLAQRRARDQPGPEG